MTEQTNQQDMNLTTEQVQPAVNETVADNATTVAQNTTTDQTNLILGKFKTNDDLVKAYTSLESMLGKKVSQLSPDEAKILKELQGAPKTVEEYGVPEGSDPEVAKWFNQLAHKHGIDKNTTMELLAAYSSEVEKVNEQAVQAQKEIHEKYINELKAEFGSAFEKRVDLATKTALDLGGQQLVDVLKDAGIGAHPAVIKALAKVGQSMAEDSVPQSQYGAKFGTTPEEAKVLINQKMLDSEFRSAYLNGRHPAHDAAVQEMYRLHELAAKQG